jgi:hypothetical protein
LIFLRLYFSPLLLYRSQYLCLFSASQTHDCIQITRKF